ncbi:MAG: metallophosphoesterase, partial [Clostridia bacterium]|nr:metallophosphoesterase [Clostridia bacterium]
MKKVILYLILVLACAALLTFGVLATDVSTEQDIINAISTSSSGDKLSLALKNDIEITYPITVSKGVEISIDFNGHQLNYTGNAGSDASKGGFVLASASAVLNLIGSNPLDSYSTYTHYDETVKADMTGTGNLIVVAHGKLNIKNAYLYAPDDAWAIYGKLDNENNCQITIENSVLRSPQGSARSAITSFGKDGYSTAIKRTVVAENSVIYGGFKGQNSFNYTIGTSFTNVKFYDFKLENDCWYTAGAPQLMNSYEAAATFTGCIFHTYEGELGGIAVAVSTGKQNIKLIDCQFNGSVTGSLNGDRGGNACVWVVTKMPTCQESGSAIKYSGSNASSSTEAVSANVHSYGEEKIVYPDGYSSAGALQAICELCSEPSLLDAGIEPIFKSTGYSLYENGNSVSFGVRINGEAFNAFKQANPQINLEFGIIVGNDTIEVTFENGEIKVENGFYEICKMKNADFFDVKLSNIKDSQKDVKFVMEAYVNDGEKLEYIEEGIDLLSYNDIKDSLDKVKSAVRELLETKHRLYYNDDGSFRVLIIADAHMNVTGNATDVQEVKDRIKLLVDKENPNLVIFTGDNTIGSSTEQRLRDNIDALVSYIEEKQIPWCHVYGNHDHEGALSNAEQQKIFETYEYCVSKTGVELSGTGNYVLGVYNKDDSLGSVIYCLDSGAYDSVNGGYDYIKADQIEWYREASMLLQEYNDGKAVKGMMAFHIPLIENNVAYNNRSNPEIVYEATGDRNEEICASKTDTNLLEVIFERGDVKAIVTGHDHVNDYMYNYYGVKLCSSPNVSDLTYHNVNVQGGRVFDLSLDTIDNIPTYVSYLIERINPDKFGVLDSNITLEDFEGEAPTTAINGYDGATISGSITLNVAEGKGKDGSSAIEVTRSNTANSEFYIYLDESNYGKLGKNKYVVVWMDFTNVEFRKACIGLLSASGIDAYRTDDDDGTNPPMYYLADSGTEWQTLSHGGDGCFGSGDGNNTVLGKKGYFAFRTEDLCQGAGVNGMNESTLVTGFYMYLDIK